MAPVYTVLRRARPPGEGAPSLLFHKWHRYERFEEERSVRKGRVKVLDAFERLKMPFLEEVAEAVRAINQQRYSEWHERFTAACRRVSRGNDHCWRFKTQWRMVVGWAENPALETGLTLHHLLGFPHIPGSAVKGLVHRVAELEVMSSSGPAVDDAFPPLSESSLDLTTDPPASLRGALARALRVRILFGALTAERGVDETGTAFGIEGPIERAREWFAALRAAREAGLQQSHDLPASWKDVLDTLGELCGEPTGGLVTWFDAVPTASAFDGLVVAPDVLTAHHTKYYAADGHLPSDDEDPVPNHFLALQPGVTFEFRYRLTWPRTAAHDTRDTAEGRRLAALAGWTRSDAQAAIDGWLGLGLGEFGIGGKTAAGYGYFKPVGECDESHSTGEARRKQDESELPPAVASPAEAAAASALPAGLPDGTVGDYVDRAMSLPPAVQRVVAQRVRRHYPDVVRKWLARAPTKQTVARRLQWLTAMGGEQR